MTIVEAQRDLQRAFVGGGPGVFVSGILWLAAGVVEQTAGIGAAFAVLFFGGMLIFPLATAASRLIFRAAKETAGNPLGATALESTIAMIGGLFAAWLFLPYQPAFVFPLAAIAVGTHYAVFKTVYGDPVFWILGAIITAVGLVSIFELVAIPGGPIIAVGAIELLFACVLTVRARRTSKVAG